MRKLRRLAIIGAACAGLTGTVLTGSASAATGGGCGVATDGIQACATWVTGQGFGYYIRNSELKNTEYKIGVFYCPTGSVANSRTKCGKFSAVPGEVCYPDVTSPGNYPSPPCIWGGASRAGYNHGIAHSEFFVHVPLAGWVPAGDSPEVYW